MVLWFSVLSSNAEIQATKKCIQSEVSDQTINLPICIVTKQEISYLSCA